MLVMLIFGTREAPATVEEQRARLPPAAECTSPVAGKWKALVYQELSGIWYEFILEVREDDNNPATLKGEIFVDAWDGSAHTPEPPVPCQRRYKVKMPGSGRFVDGRFEFGGGRWELQEVVCGVFTSYNPDHFSGQLEPEIHEFQAVNNDGGMAVNEPAVFRRIRCIDEKERKDPGSAVAPPPFFPKQRSSGC
jgi:hypothetical protein